jgi:hypothetical protein
MFDQCCVSFFSGTYLLCPPHSSLDELEKLVCSKAETWEIWECCTLKPEEPVWEIRYCLNFMTSWCSRVKIKIIKGTAWISLKSPNFSPYYYGLMSDIVFLSVASGPCWCAHGIASGAGGYCHGAAAFISDVKKLDCKGCRQIVAYKSICVNTCWSLPPCILRYEIFECENMKMSYMLLFWTWEPENFVCNWSMKYAGVLMWRFTLKKRWLVLTRIITSY